MFRRGVIVVGVDVVDVARAGATCPDCDVEVERDKRKTQKTGHRTAAQGQSGTKKES